MRTAYFSTGEILQGNSGKAVWKRAVSNFLSAEPGVRVWFRPCDEWRKAEAEYFRKWLIAHPGYRGV